MKIALITDLHYGPPQPGRSRRSELADVLLMEAVRRLNRRLHPDVTLLLGDLLEDGNAADARDRLKRMRAILETLESPWLAIPGNHDGDADGFYRVMPHPGPWRELAGARFLPFVDRPEPGYNASRERAELDRFQQARTGFDGPLVALQHTCLFPPELELAPFAVLDPLPIITAMRQVRVALSISGHYHAGAAPVCDGGVTYVHAAALCEKPFPMHIATLDETGVHVQREDLGEPPC